MTMPDPFVAAHIWFRDMKASPVRLALLYRKVCLNAGKIQFPSIVAAPLLPLESFVCSECGKDFPSRQQLLTHSFAKHGYRNPLRCRVLTFNCLACNLLLHNRHQVFKHISRKGCINPCAFFHMEHMEPVDQNSLDGILSEKVSS